jgi:hypothetical protein
MNQCPLGSIGSFVHVMVGVSHPVVEFMLTTIQFFNANHFLGLV